MEVDLLGLALLIAGAFGASILYLLLIRQASRSHRGKVIDLLKALGVGSTFSIVAALVLSFMMLIPIIVVIIIVGGTEDESTIWAAVLVAPIAEELTKGVGVMFFRKRFTGLESGLIYGACIGLGFAAVENVLYGFEQLTTEGLESALTSAWVARRLGGSRTCKLHRHHRLWSGPLRDPPPHRETVGLVAVLSGGSVPPCTV